MIFALNENRDFFPIFKADTDESYIPFMPNVLKVFLENGQTKSFKYDNKTTVKVCNINFLIFIFVDLSNTFIS